MASLSPTTIEIVKATIPAIEAHGFEIVKAMYGRMFTHPEIRMLFNQTHHEGGDAQPRVLAGAILAYARHIEDPSVLAATIERIAQKHVSLQILPEHYPYVAEALLGAIGEVLGAAATPEILAAWGEAYWFLADVLIGREKALYDGIAAQDGGWTGWRDFVVAERRRESDRITSFVLRPVDGGPVLRHRPGQYLAFDLTVDGARTRRNYSISSAPNGQSYQITVKRQGAASAWLHEAAVPGTVLRVAAPAGDFFFEDSGRPVVLLSGGVGLTPMLSILETMTEAQRSRTHFVHATESGASLAAGPRTRALAGRATLFFERPVAEDLAGRDYDAAGRIPAGWLGDSTDTGADYYICGPKPFMAMAVRELARAGVPEARLAYEFFGPTEALEIEEAAAA